MKCTYTYHCDCSRQAVILSPTLFFIKSLPYTYANNFTHIYCTNCKCLCICKIPLNNSIQTIITTIITSQHTYIHNKIDKSNNYFTYISIRLCSLIKTNTLTYTLMHTIHIYFSTKASFNYCRQNNAKMSIKFDKKYFFL